MICPKCKRENKPWPIKRGNNCGPKNWEHCIRWIDPMPLSEVDPYPDGYELPDDAELPKVVNGSFVCPT